MKKVLFFFTLCLSLMDIWAQPVAVLEKTLQRNDIPDTQRIDVMNQLGRDLTFVDPLRSATLANDALKKSLDISYKRGEAYAYRVLAGTFSNNNSSIIAQEYLQRALKIFKAIDDSAGIANCLITEGLMYRRLRQFGKELQLEQAGYGIFLRHQIPDRIAVAAHNLGETYLNTGDIEQSFSLTTLAIHLNDSLKQLSVLSNCYKVMGKIYLAKKNDTAAVVYFLKALDISKELGANSQKVATIESMMAVAEIYQRRGNHQQHAAYMKQAAAFARENLLLNYLNTIYTSLIAAYSNETQQVDALALEYKSVSEEINNKLLLNQNDLNKFGSEIYAYLDEQKILLEKQNAVQQQRIRNSNLLLAVAISAGIMLAALAVFLLRSLAKQRRSEKEIVEKKEQLRALAARIHQVREQERSIIASRVHEELGQQLIVMKMDINWLTRQLQDADPIVVSKTIMMEKLLHDAINTVRNIASELRPPVLDDIGLEVAIKFELSEFEKKYHVKTDFEARGIAFFLSDEIKTGLFRIFQEGLSNIATHAFAKNLSVFLFYKTNELVLVIKDNGVGFDTNEENSSSKIGLLSLEEQSKMLNGRITFQSSPGNGTTISIQVPVTQQQYA